MKMGCVFVALVAAGALLVGCGGGNDRQATEASSGAARKAHQRSPKLPSINLTLEGYPDAENAGVLMADQRGYFTEAGFQVNVLHPVDSDNVPGFVANEDDDFGLLPLPQVATSRGKGRPLVAIGSLVQRSTMAMIWPRESNIDGLADLKGKTIAINGFLFEEEFLKALLAKAGLTPDDVAVKSVSYELVPALVKGRADAILGSGNIEGIELEARGLKPVVTSLQRLGIPAYEELVMVTRRDRLSGDPSWIRRFMSAVTRGNVAAIEDPEAAAMAILERRKELVLPGAQLKLIQAKVKATLPLLGRTGQMNRGQATRLVDWMGKHGLIQHKLPVAGLLTNRYVLPRS
jgi:putative hydroxymethylpyrimidine transport system substrate-binding protein